VPPATVPEVGERDVTVGTAAAASFATTTIEALASAATARSESAFFGCLMESLLDHDSRWRQARLFG
jgi:hypothetical protein